jgi:hypothetical protein
MGAQNQAGQFGAQAANTAGLQNADALNSNNQFNAGLLQQGGMFNAGAANDAGQFLAGAQNTAGLQNASMQQQAGLANQDAAMQAQMANQSAGLQANSQALQGAGLLGNLGQQQQGMNLNAANALNAFGTQGQELDQAALDRQFQQYLLQQQYGQNQIANMQGLLGTIPALYAGASTTGKTTSTPSVASMVGTGLQVASMFSDVRLKTDIQPIGKRGGHDWYAYRYLWDEPGTVRQGVMAQEVIHTGAVSVHPSGYLMVNYGAL